MLDANDRIVPDWQDAVAAQRTRIEMAIQGGRDAAKAVYRSPTHGRIAPTLSDSYGAYFGTDSVAEGLRERARLAYIEGTCHARRLYAGSYQDALDTLARDSDGAQKRIS